jgi:hypothetical protein
MNAMDTMMKRAVTTISTPFLSISLEVDSPISLPEMSKYPKWTAKEDHSKIETRKIGFEMTAMTLWMVSFILLQIVESSRCEPARSIVQMVIKYLRRELALALSSGSIQTGCSGIVG